MMGGLWQDIRFASRSLSTAPGFALVVVLILGIGIGANVAMFSIIDSTMIRPLPYPEPERLVLGRATFGGRVNPYASAYDYWDYRDFSTSFEQLAAFWGFSQNFTVTGADEPERVSGVIVSIDLFPALGVSPQLGRGFSAEEAQETGPNVVIISHGYWQRRFGGAADVIGRTLVLDDQAYEVIGVMPAGYRFYHDVEVWRPMRPNSPYVGARRFHNWIMLGRLKPGVTIEQAQSEVDVISAQLEAQYPDSNREKALLLTELQEALAEGYRQSLYILMAAVALVLLIACGNVASLTLARGSARRTELSTRAALGASGVRLVRQLLTESLVMAVAAGILGTLLAIWLRSLLLQLLAVEQPAVERVGFASTVLLFALVISLVTGLVFGVVPALRASRGDLVGDLKSGARTTDAGGNRFRNGLVVAQVAVSIVLLIGAGLLIRSLATLMGVDVGFDTRNLLTAEVRLRGDEYADQERRIQFYKALRENVRAVPGVESVALINQLPIRDPGNNIYVWDEQNPPVDPGDIRSAWIRAVFPGYFETMGIPRLSGRGIEETDVDEAPAVLVVSRTFADSILPGKDPVGQRVVVDFGEPYTFEVVGVVEDIKMNSLLSTQFPAMYGSYYQIPFRTMRLAVRTAVPPGSVVGGLREAVWNLDRDLPVAEVATMDDVLARSLSARRTRTVALGMFAGVALLLAAVGLYGVLAYYVSRRHHEIGIRVALGAEKGDMVELVLKRGLVLVAVGIALGLVGAFGVTRTLNEVLYQVEPTDPMTFALVSLFFALVAVIACLLPAWRALRVDPLIALQAE
jgi:putative ABC transport system permease protein